MNLLLGEKILIGTSSFAELDRSPFERLQQTGCEILKNPFRRKIVKAELIELLSDGITGLIAGLESLDYEVLKASRLKVISRCGSGLSNVDLTAAGELGIEVCATPHAPVEAVAELTLGNMLNLLREIPQMDKDLHQGKWGKRIGSELLGKTVVIIGFGRIGQRLAKLLAPFNVSILAVDPYVKEAVCGVSIVSLEQALPQADIVVIHSSGDKCILGDKEFSLFKPGALLLNAARGQLLNETSLVNALEKGRIKGVWIDSFAQEPYKGPLIHYPQAILTPHVGSYTIECRRQMELKAVENLISAFVRVKEAKK